MGQLDQKVAVITGADSGIGRGIALELASAGATIVINYAHAQDKAEEVRQQEDLPMPENVPYCCAKGGMRMLMRTICLELAPYNITVNNIGPGAIDTPIDADVKADPKKYKALLDEIPLHRMGQPEEIGKLALYLASDAAAYVTGSTFFIDGGLMRNTGGL
ncbi:SDR family oxidoreductase [Dictyobacter formicarum]|uniref:Uncharacterized protein n=1 Tax=Dictyobacter formicarum TaxID=2778368 RepID=A0ABQ3VCZ0_9CHLR|nr:SDR family oxidoreductase [Dictyobacter formicarum]GHO83845.1 hypothetical protein KSZ_18510 [Dictyobacter formicarum]